MFSIMWVTLCKHITCTSLYVYDANALITFVEPDISVADGVPVGLGVLAIVITVIIVACLIRYMVKEKGENNTKIAEN